MTRQRTPGKLSVLLSLFFLFSAGAGGARGQAGPAGLDAAASAAVARGLAALGVSPGAEYIARGTATLRTRQGEETGPFTIELAGLGQPSNARCRVEIDLSRPGRARLYVAVRDGKTVGRRAPTGMLEAPPAAGREQGCALLPQGLPWGAGLGGASADLRAGRIVHVELDPDTGLPRGAAWRWGSHRVAIEYSGFAPGGGPSYPARVIERVDGGAVLTLRIDSFARASGLAPGEFTLAGPGVKQ